MDCNVVAADMSPAMRDAGRFALELSSFGVESVIYSDIYSDDGVVYVRYGSELTAFYGGIQ